MSREDLARRDLARRAASAPGWSFMPGVSYWYPARWFGDRDMLVRVSDRPDHAEALNRERTGAEALPDLDDHATLGCIEHGMLPAAWESVLPGERVAVEVLHTHEYDTVLRRCVPAFAVRVLVWDGTTWSTHWQTDKVTRARVEALVLCLEAAAERREP